MSKKKNRQQYREVKSSPLVLRQISPLTENQQKTFDAYYSGKSLILHGYAGTGKTFISLYLSLNELLRDGTYYDKIILLRSVVPSRDMGFLPGTMKEKIRVYEEPYIQICHELFGKNEYDALKVRGSIEFSTTSYLRGLTFNNSIIIIDEMQNMSGAELDTVMTRIGENSKIIFCGDFRQTDLKGYEKDGLKSFLSIVKSMNQFLFVDFEKEDIVRSGLVRDYIIRKVELEL